MYNCENNRKQNIFHNMNTNYMCQKIQDHYLSRACTTYPNLHVLCRFLFIVYIYLADNEHDRPLSSAHTPHVVKTSYAVLHVQKQLGTLQGSTGGKGGERERERERERESSNQFIH